MALISIVTLNSYAECHYVECRYAVLQRFIYTSDKNGPISVRFRLEATVTTNTRHLSTYIPILCIKTITIIISIAMLNVIQGQTYKTFYGGNYGFS